MEELDYWRLCDELSVIQAALLTVGVDPSSEEGSYCESEGHKQPHGYEAVKTAIANALKCNAITGRVVSLNDDGEISLINNKFAIEDKIDIFASKVNVESLRAWLVTRNFEKGFFFPEIVETADYMDPDNPRYAPKLAAAVRAWQAVIDPGKKSAKQALEKWLRENAAKFGLVSDDGNPSNLAVEECAKVANWSPGGGAPKTSAG